jgi:hypothetical protein
VAAVLAFDLDLDLFLIFRPFGRPSVGVHQGVRRVAPCGAAAHIERRSSRSRPEAMPPHGHRSEGTRSLSEAPYAGAKPFAYFSASGKVSRCKSETIISRYRSNGYTPKPQNPSPPPNRRQTKTPGINRAFCIDLISERGK